MGFPEDDILTKIGVKNPFAQRATSKIICAIFMFRRTNTLCVSLSEPFLLPLSVHKALFQMAYYFGYLFIFMMLKYPFIGLKKYLTIPNCQHCMFRPTLCSLESGHKKGAGAQVSGTVHSFSRFFSNLEIMIFLPFTLANCPKMFLEMGISRSLNGTGGFTAMKFIFQEWDNWKYLLVSHYVLCIVQIGMFPTRSNKVSNETSGKPTFSPMWPQVIHFQYPTTPQISIFGPAPSHLL